MVLSMNMRYWFSAAVILLVILLSSTVEGATIRGTVYGPDFGLLKNVVISVNSTPEQLYIAKNGEYTFNLGVGEYLIEAKYYSSALLEYSGIEKIKITTLEGDFIVDFILLPSIEDEKLFQNYPELEELFVEKTENTLVISIVIFAFILGAIIYLRLRKRSLVKDVAKSEEEVPEDLKKMIEIINKSDGRISQKELRRKMLPYSEAKVSLMVADLEDRGFIRKMKVGRGNIIVLKP